MIQFPRITGSILVLAVLASSLCGCITKTAGVSDGEQANWIVGKTTQRDVVGAWGNPDKISDDVWIWKDWQLIGGKLKVAYMMVGLTVSNARASTREYRLTFDGNGRLIGQETVESVPGGVSWSVLPVSFFFTR